MNSRLVIDGNAVYEIDEECMKKKERNRTEKNEGERKELPRQNGKRTR